MHHVPTRIPLASWLLLALFSLAAFAPPGGIGVCIGEDGHVAFGDALSGCPCPGELPDAPGDCDDDEHPDCADLTLESQIGQTPAELDSSWDRAPGWTLASVQPAEARWVDAPVRQTGRNDLRCSPPLRSLHELRTVVLRV